MEETASLHNIKHGDPCYTLAIFYDGEYKEINVDISSEISPWKL